MSTANSNGSDQSTQLSSPIRVFSVRTHQKHVCNLLKAMSQIHKHTYACGGSINQNCAAKFIHILGMIANSISLERTGIDKISSLSCQKVAYSITSPKIGDNAAKQTSVLLRNTSEYIRCYSSSYCTV